MNSHMVNLKYNLIITKQFSFTKEIIATTTCIITLNLKNHNLLMFMGVP